MTRTISVHLLIGTALLSQGIVTSHAEEPLVGFVRVTTVDGASILGELKKEELNKIELHDLRTDKDVSFDIANVRRVDKSVSENAAVQSLGLPLLLTWKINKCIPVNSGQGAIAKVSGSVVYVSLGAKQGLNVGDKLTVFRGETELKDPTSGDVLGKERRKIGMLEVTEVREKFCKAKQLGELEIVLNTGDVVELMGFNNALAIIPFVNLQGLETVAGRQVSEELTTGLVKRGVTVVERSRFADVLGELVIQQTGLFDADKAQQLGKQIGAYAILTGTMVPKEKYLEAQVRLIEVKTGKILFASSYKTKGSMSVLPNAKPIARVAHDIEPAEKKGDNKPIGGMNNLARKLTVGTWQINYGGGSVYVDLVFRLDGTREAVDLKRKRIGLDGKVGGKWAAVGDTVVAEDHVIAFKGDRIFSRYPSNDGEVVRVDGKRDGKR